MYVGPGFLSIHPWRPRDAARTRAGSDSNLRWPTLAAVCLTPWQFTISVDALLGSVGSVSCLVAYSLPLGNPRVLPQHGSSTMEIPRSRRRYRNLRGALLHGRITHLVQLV